MSVTVVGVAVEGTAYHFDKLYTYLVPAAMPVPAVGCRVVVPFGGGNTKRTGFVLECGAAEDTAGLKALSGVIDAVPLLSAEMVQLAFFMKEHTFCCLFDACKVMLPTGIMTQMTDHYRAAGEGAVPHDVPDNIGALIGDLRKSGKSVQGERLLSTYHVSFEELEGLVKKGLLTKEREAVRRMGDATVQTIALTDQGRQEETAVDLTPKQRAVWKLLQEVGETSVKEACYFTGVTPAVIAALRKKGVVHLWEEEVYRTPNNFVVSAPASEIRLSPVQQQAFDRLRGCLQQAEGAAALLYGVTGSGKTSVYLKLIEEARRQSPKGGIIVMVPEIALTPQTVSIFKGRYGDGVAIFHSRLSLGERLDEWKRVKKGEAAIVVGTRSAVFAPFEHISLIVIDEEQEHTYKSEAAPRFHARDIARFRAAYHGALLVLASATPSMESFAKAKAGVYTLCTMEQRYGKAALPTVQVVDLLEEREKGNLSAIGEQLLSLLEQTLARHKQAVLLLNRRGYHTFISCSQCGQVAQCPECSISMTYHRDNDRLMCHYCGHSAPLPKVCPKCGGEMMKMTGLGTQKAEEQLQELLPDARILRMDADSTMSRTAHSEKLTAFAKGEYDILLGTQMVAKGLDFPAVSLVGVLNADQMLHNNDYRAYERGFSLLTQVIGRAGRADGQGLAVIQTAEPDHELIELAKGQQYEAFYEQEIALRKMMEYPPYCDLCLVGFVGSDQTKTMQASRNMLTIIKDLVQTQFPTLPLKILGPAPAMVVKVGGKYRYRMLMKCRNTKAFRAMMHKALCTFGAQKETAGVTAFADMNPEGFL